MTSAHEGIPASPGIIIAPARVLRMEAPAVPHGGIIPPDRVEAEVERLRDACEWVKGRIRALQESTREKLGEVEAQIFEPQILMLEDSDLIGGAEEYIRENHLTAERAFEWRVLEWEAQWSHTAHPMVMDKLNDLGDVQTRVLRRLLGLPDLALGSVIGDDKVILVARDLTPSIAAQLDANHVVGLATDLGTRTSHSSILARSLNIPAVVGLGNLSEKVSDGQEIVLDGRSGRVLVEPSEEEKEVYRQRDFQTREWEQALLLLAHLDAETLDGVKVALRANIDLPGEAESARAHGADGIGLFRTEFLVVGRNVFPGEEEQFAAYRNVAMQFPDRPVVIRTFDLGGDKFPAFLHMPKEENPFLGWRAIRLCLDQPELFDAQLRAILRASAYGHIQVMLPLVNDISEVEATRDLLDEAAEKLRSEGHEIPDTLKLGAMVETPAAALLAPDLAKHVDFFSIGTNDLVQYTLAVDRGNTRLAHLYKPFHPSVVRLLSQIVDAGKAADIEVSVCGEFAAHPLGALLLIGLGVDSLSVGPASLAEIKQVIRALRQDEAAAAARAALEAKSSEDVIEILTETARDRLELDQFPSVWSLSSNR